MSWWMVRDHLLKGVRFGTPALDLHLYSVGVGRTPPRSSSVRGVVGAGEVNAHQSSIKVLFLALQCFQELVAV